MTYEMEELVPVVAKLSNKYTGFESTSISYEKAQQLMEAVLYCVMEPERNGERFPMSTTRPDAEFAYQRGLLMVKKKAADAMEAYQKLLAMFDDYENKNLSDTVRKGITGFFQYYDYTFAPQNTIITMDYPTLNQNRELTGIDAVAEYIHALSIEQTLLSRLPRQYVISILFQSEPNFRIHFGNISTVLCRNLTVRALLNKQGVKMNGYVKLAEYVKKTSLEELKEKLFSVFQTLLETYYSADESDIDYTNQEVIFTYYKTELCDLAVQLKNVSDPKNLKNVVII